MIAEPIVTAWSPACFEPDELARWQQSDALVQRTGGHSVLPCAECLPAFSNEMHAAKSPEYANGRRNGTPKGGQEDTEMDDLMMAAVRIPGEVTTQANAIAPLGPMIPRRLQPEVTAPPCGSCIHEPICALRTAFEGMATVETSAPPLPDGLRLVLVATVECSHFLRDRAKPAPVRVLTSQERGQANGPGAKRKASYEWTPEQRAAQAERTRARYAATRAAAG